MRGVLVLRPRVSLQKALWLWQNECGTLAICAARTGRMRGRLPCNCIAMAMTQHTSLTELRHAHDAAAGAGRLRTCVFEKQSDWRVAGLLPVGVRMLQLQGCIDRDGLLVSSNCNRLHKRTRTYNGMTHVVDTCTLHHNASICHSDGGGFVKHRTESLNAS